MAGVYRLEELYREDEYVIAEGTSLRMRVRVGLSAYGDSAPLTVGADISDERANAVTYFYRGGYEHTTTDPAIRQLWIDSGFDVTEE